MNVINDNKTMRFTLLFSLYITVNGRYEMTRDISMLADHNGIGNRDFKSIFRYLAEEELIESRKGDNEYYAGLTHKGLKAVEEVFHDTHKKTYYFPSYSEMQK